MYKLYLQEQGLKPGQSFRLTQHLAVDSTPFTSFDKETNFAPEEILSTMLTEKAKAAASKEGIFKKEKLAQKFIFADTLPKLLSFLKIDPIQTLQIFSDDSNLTQNKNYFSEFLKETHFNEEDLNVYVLSERNACDWKFNEKTSIWAPGMMSHSDFEKYYGEGYIDQIAFGSLELTELKIKKSSFRAGENSLKACVNSLLTNEGILFGEGIFNDRFGYGLKKAKSMLGNCPAVKRSTRTATDGTLNFLAEDKFSKILENLTKSVREKTRQKSIIYAVFKPYNEGENTFKKTLHSFEDAISPKIEDYWALKNELLSSIKEKSNQNAFKIYEKLAKEVFKDIQKALENSQISLSEKEFGIKPAREFKKENDHENFFKFFKTKTKENTHLTNSKFQALESSRNPKPLISDKPSFPLGFSEKDRYVSVRTGFSLPASNHPSLSEGNPMNLPLNNIVKENSMEDPSYKPESVIEEIEEGIEKQRESFPKIKKSTIRYFSHNNKISELLKVVQRETDMNEHAEGPAVWPSYPSGEAFDPASETRAPKYRFMLRVCHPANALLSFKESEFGIGISLFKYPKDMLYISKMFDEDSLLEKRILQIIEVDETAYKAMAPLRKNWRHNTIVPRSVSVGENFYVYHPDILSTKEAYETVLKMANFGGKMGEETKSEIEDIGNKSQEFCDLLEMKKERNDFRNELTRAFEMEKGVLTDLEFLQIERVREDLLKKMKNLHEDNVTNWQSLKSMVKTVAKREKKMNSLFNKIQEKVEKVIAYIRSSLNEVKESKLSKALDFCVYLDSLLYSMMGYNNPTGVVPWLTVRHEISCVYDLRAPLEKIRLLFYDLHSSNVKELTGEHFISNYEINFVESDKDKEQMENYLLQRTPNVFEGLREILSNGMWE